jgi:diguanylate cyclase (GGDEF)-like protein/PAS domain S-box-containing protein
VDWPARTFDHLSDLVAVVDADGQIVYANPRGGELLGVDPSEVVGRNMVEFLHPDELDRAARVVARIAGHGLNVPVTPAVYRLRNSDGTWRPVEINATVVDSGAGGDVVVIVGRYSGDRDLLDRTLRDLTRGEPIDEVVELIPLFGNWRHPDDHYAVIYQADDGRRRVIGSRLIAELVAIDHDNGPWAAALHTGKRTIALPDELPDEIARRAAALGLTDAWVEPVHDPLHRAPAVIMAWCRTDGPDLAVHEYPVEIMANALALVLQWRQQVAGLRRAARRDPLTGLANRTGFWEVLEALRSDHRQPQVGILYVDLDGFKGVNDAHGHTFGDSVLAAAAHRISLVLRPGDTVARLGGDEFAVICQDLGGDDDAVTIAERVVHTLDEPFDVEGVQVKIGASVGIATVSADALDPDELLEAADRALYRAKHDGRGRWHLAS